MKTNDELTAREYLMISEKISNKVRNYGYKNGCFGRNCRRELYDELNSHINARLGVTSRIDIRSSQIPELLDILDKWRY